MKGWLRRLKPGLSNPPVFIRQADAVLSWSPRAGCSHAIFWAFLHEGVLDRAAAESPLPHRYRTFSYQREPRYHWDLLRVMTFGAPRRVLIRVTRDPKRRLVSIFRHCCRNAIVHAESRTRLGFDPSVEGFALADLDRLLDGMVLTHPTTVDPHLMVQSNPLWDLPFGRTITVNIDEVPLNASLNAIERELGLPVTAFETVPAFRKLRKSHNAKLSSFSGDGPIEAYRFGSKETKEFPVAELLRSPLLERMSRTYYAADYGRVASGDTAGVLVQPSRKPTQA